MKKVFVFCLCLLLLVGCTGSGSSAKTSAKLPDALEAVSIKDHPFVYRSGDTTYLYASGKSVALYKGEIFGGIYNYLTDGTSLCYIDPNGKLYTVRFRRVDRFARGVRTGTDLRRQAHCAFRRRPRAGVRNAVGRARGA